MTNKSLNPAPATIRAPFDPEVELSDQRTVTAGRYIQHQTQAKPAFSLHAGLEIGIVLSGCILRCWEGHRRLLQPGDVWFTGLFEPHGSAVRRAPCVQLNLAIWPDLLANLRLPELPDVDWLQPFLLPPARRPQIKAEARPRILAFARHMPTNWYDSTPEAMVRVRLHLIELLLLLRETSCAPPPRPQRARALYTQLAPAVQLALRSRTRILATDAAAACGMGTPTFQRRFQMLMGLSFSRFSLRHRVSGVADDLLAGNAPLKSLAADWGFTDSSHLVRVFVEHYRCTPSAYRNQGGSRPSRRLPRPHGDAAHAP